MCRSDCNTASLQLQWAALNRIVFFLKEKPPPPPLDLRITTIEKVGLPSTTTTIHGKQVPYLCLLSMTWQKCPRGCLRFRAPDSLAFTALHWVSPFAQHHRNKNGSTACKSPRWPKPIHHCVVLRLFFVTPEIGLFLVLMVFLSYHKQEPGQDHQGLSLQQQPLCLQRFMLYSTGTHTAPRNLA